MKTFKGHFALILAITALALVGCGNQATTTPTLDSKEVYTQVAQTVQAQITNNAKLTPQASSTVKPTDSPAATATLRPSSTPVNLTPGAATLTPQKSGTQASLTPQKTNATLVIPPQATATGGAVVATQPSAANSPDKMLYVSQGVADGTTFAQSQGFTMTWTMQNIGTTTWDNTYQVRLYAGERFDGADTKLDQTVKPNAQAKISIDMRAPNTMGEYTTVWVITNPEGRNFGSFTLTIKVK